LIDEIGSQMEIRTGSIDFEALSGDGPRRATAEVHFPREIRRAITGLSGYDVGFSKDRAGDHPLGQLQVRLSTEADGDLVKITATYGLRDWSGHWDDLYRGTVFFVVLAELEAADAPHPRGDMSIVGIEVTQAIQHFRSHEHLDATNVRPDNSIQLIARKDTGLRLYVDYDADAGLPPVDWLSGRITVNSGSTVLDLTPMQSIRPRDTTQINRGKASHTLNFVIPEAWCRGDVEIICKVFDTSNPSLPSRRVTRTLSFEAQVPLPIFAVGIRYTGQDASGNDLDIPAPTVDDIVQNLEFVELTYPVPEVFITGYSEIVVDKTFPASADAEFGCGDGFSDLLGTLRDMRGDSADVYYGFLADNVPTGGVAGCGGNGVAAGKITDQAAMAQEVGHAYGRQHAPCDSEDRCQNPQNQDSNYPQYADFPSDSIGEFGYDPRTDTVFEPAKMFDFMGYSPREQLWVSPYTYMGLMGAFQTASGLERALRPAAVAAAAHVKHMYGERPRIKRVMLDLELLIDRNMTVTRRHSFHFPVIRSRSRGKDTDFTVAILDGDGNPLHCQTLMRDCLHCGSCDCGPQHFRQWLPFSATARKLVVHHKGLAIYEEEIPPPAADRCRGGVCHNQKAAAVSTALEVEARFRG
jgi:hypothetical protein